MNNGHEDAFVKWKVKGKDKSLFVKAKGKARRMMTIHGGNPKPVAFSAYSKENNKQLAVNREKSVQFRPRLHKFYNFIRIDGKSDAIDLLAVQQKSLDQAIFLYNFIQEARLSGVRASITIVHIRKF